jgi:hypothetical protein
MRFDEIFSPVAEAVTTQNFRFGFEFECVLPKELDAYKIANELPVKFKATPDGSIKEPSGYLGIELVSEPLLLNPQNIIAAKTSIIELLKRGCQTNKSCGFHVHYSSDSLDYNAICWLMIVLASNDDMLTPFLEFKRFSFIDVKYAHLGVITKIKQIIAQPNCTPAAVAELITNEKKSILRLHPQGTLEWRGPRNFMNKGDFEIISDFFLNLYRMADLIDRAVKTPQVAMGNKVLTREMFYTYLNSNPQHKKGNLKSTPLKDTRFAREQDMSLLGEIFKRAPWLKKAKFIKAVITLDSNHGIDWNSGIWLNGTWHNGVWQKGIWENGDWLNGVWMNGIWKNGTWHAGKWYAGDWENGNFQSGDWVNGDWDGGTWGKNAHWIYGINSTKDNFVRTELNPNEFDKTNDTE